MSQKLNSAVAVIGSTRLTSIVRCINTVRIRDCATS